jgi:multidrug efflux pump subunit AcrA (membrane-fusion protein)
MSRKTSLLILTGLMFLPGCGGQDPPQQEGQLQPTVVAQLETVEALSFPEVYEAVGTIRSSTTTTLSSRSMGYITAIHVVEGSRITPGQLLVEIDSREFQARVLQARANLEQEEHSLEEIRRDIGAGKAAQAAANANAELAESTLRRFERLMERNSVSRQEFDEVVARSKVAVAEQERAKEMLEAQNSGKKRIQAQIKQAEAALEETEVFLSQTQLRASIAGLVIGKHVNVGDLATPGLPLLTLEDPTEYRLETAVKESAITWIRSAQQVSVRIAALDQELAGTVGQIVPAANPSSRSFLIKIDLPRHASLHSGMYGTARFSLGERSTLAVPATALVSKGQLTGVYVVDQSGGVRFQLVKTGKQYGDRMEILSGLQEGQVYVVHPDERIQEGVQISDQSNLGSGADHA